MFGEGVEVGEGGAGEVFDHGAGPIEALGLALAGADDGAEPVGVIAALFFEGGEEGFAGAFEFVGGGAVGGEFGGEVADDGAELGGIFGFGDEHGEGLAIAGEGVAHHASDLGAIGFAQFFADLEADAVVEDFGEEGHVAGEADVVHAVGGGPVDGDHGLGDFASKGEGFFGDIGRESDLAGVGEGGAGGFARGEGAEGGGHGGDDFGGVEVADDADFEEAAFEDGVEPGFGLGDGAGGEGGLGGEEEAVVLAVGEGVELGLHDALGGVAELLIHGGEAFAELGDAVFAPAGGAELGGHELALEEEVLAVGAAGEEEGVFADGELGGDGAAGEEALEVVGAVFGETGEVEDGAGEEVEAGLVAGEGEAAGAEEGGDLDGIFFEVGGFDIEADAVGEGDLGDVEVGDGLLGGDFTGWAEVGVGEGLVGLLDGRGDGLGGAAAEGGEDGFGAFF